MIWLTWRQSRAQILSVAAVVAVFAVVMTAQTTGARVGDPTRFLAEMQLKGITHLLYNVATAACLLVPPLIGAFWGAPLIARELETGTFRLAWNQSLSRTRWLAFKLGGLALTAAVLTGLLSLAITWWAEAIDGAVNHGGESDAFTRARISPILFSARGVVPAAYAVAAVAIGTLVGLLVKRTVAALALTLIAVAAVQVVMPMVVRQHLMTPVTSTVSITAANLRGLMISGDPGQGSIGQVLDLRVDTSRPADWELSNQTVKGGKALSTLPSWVANCADDPVQAQEPGVKARQAACFTRLSTEGYQQRIETQPGSRFWALQLRESALLVAVAALCGAACFLKLRRLR